MRWFNCSIQMLRGICRGCGCESSLMLSAWGPVDGRKIPWSTTSTPRTASADARQQQRSYSSTRCPAPKAAAAQRGRKTLLALRLLPCRAIVASATRKELTCTHEKTRPVWQDALRKSLRAGGVVGFVMNGAILPRESGNSDRPMDSSQVRLRHEWPTGLPDANSSRTLSRGRGENSKAVYIVTLWLQNF